MTYRNLLSVSALALLALCLVFSPARAAERLIVDDVGRRVLVPSAPLRIVSLDDAAITVPLIELGVVPVASQGRVGPDGHVFVRSSLTITGQDFDNTDMEFLGIHPIDIENLAALKPDLILTLNGRPSPPDQLQAIAPTIVIDDVRRDPREIYTLLAELTGQQKRFSILERRYQAQLSQLKTMAPHPQPSVSVIAATSDGKLNVEHTQGSLGLVLREAGFPFPAITDTIARNSSATFSPEALPEFDADIIFDTYRNDKDEGPQHARRRMEALIPDYCQFLKACREGRYFFLPRDETKSTTYAARMMAIAVLTGIVSSINTSASEAK